MIAAPLAAAGSKAVCSSCRVRSSSLSMLATRRAFAPLASRSLSTQVLAAAAEKTAAQKTEVEDGVKSKIFEILTDTKPMTSAEIWAEAEKKGVRSKRHMKMMLQDLRQRGWVVTKPGAVATAKKDKAFRYELSEKTLASPRYKGPQPAAA
jgi:hypothetical protein